MNVNYILWDAPRSSKLAQKDVPELDTPGEKEVTIKAAKSLISTGTELTYYEGRHTELKTGKRSYPMSPPSYSMVGEVVKVGKKVVDFKPGDRILALCGHVSYGLVSTNYITTIPDDLKYDRAVWGVMGSIALHGVREANMQFGGNVLILGLGMVGQIVLRLSKLYPARNIIAADMVPLRLSLAEKGGADYCVDVNQENPESAVAGITAGKGCETVIDTTGNPKAVQTALKCAANRGRIVILGCPHSSVELDLYVELQKKEITLIGSYQPNCPQIETSYTPWTQQKNRELILEYILRGKLDFSDIITHRSPWNQAPELYELLSSNKDSSIGAILDWE